MTVSRRTAWLHRLLVVVLVTVIATVGVVVGALAAGYRPVVIQTGSMGDAAPPGALVIARPVAADQIAVGDVVVMLRPDTPPITHRVIEIEQHDGNRFAITKGDANEAPDGAPYPIGDDELVARWVAPSAGAWLERVFEPGLVLGVVALAALAIAFQVLRWIWQPTAPPYVPVHAAPQPALRSGKADSAAGAARQRARRRRRWVGGLAIPTVLSLTVGVSWALFANTETVGDNQFGTAACFDAQLGSVQSGEVIHALDGVLSVPIAAVDPTEAFVLASVRSSSNEPTDSVVAVQLAGGGTQVDIVRQTDAGPIPPITVSWSVVHYSCGVSVQRGTLSGDGDNVVSTPISTVDPAASFAIVTGIPETTAGTLSADDLWIPTLAATSLTITSDPSATFVPSKRFEWQVVSFDDTADVVVQNVSGSMASGESSTMLSIPQPVSPSTTFLLTGATVAGISNDVGVRLVRAHLVDGSSIQVSRAATGIAMDVTVQVVTLLDGSTVRHGIVDMAAGQPAATVAIEPVDATRSTAISTVAAFGPAAGGQSSHIADDVVGEGSATFELTSATSVQLTRGSTTSAASFGWQVIEWAGPSWWDPGYDFRQRIDIDTSSTAAPDAYTVPVTFDHAALATLGLAAPDGDDLRVVRWDGTNWSELDRVLGDTDAWDTSDTTIWFRTVAPIAESSTSTYWMYFGSDAPAPPRADPAKVFLLTEGFEGTGLGAFEDRTGGTAWYEADPWSRRIALSVGGGAVGADLVDFPLFIDIADADLATNAQADGSDLRFTAADGVTPLDHEVELWDAGSGRLAAWVRIPMLSASGPTVVHLHYGAADAPDQQNIRATWPDPFRSVWHLANDPAGSSPQLDDATVENRDGSSTGSMSAADLVSGVAGNAIDFDGADDALVGPAFDVADAGELTMSGWVRLDSYTTDARVLSKADADDPSGRSFDVVVQADGALRARMAINGTEVDVAGPAGAVALGQWHHVAVVWDGITLDLLVDGIDVASGAAAGSLDADTTRPLSIGDLAGATRRPLDGRIDEVRIEAVARSDEWLAAVVANLTDPNFVTTGAVQSGSWLEQGTWSARRPVAVDASVADADVADFRLPVQIDADPELAAVARSDGADIVFTAADGVTRLDHVIESWNPSTGALAAWVRVPLLSSSVTTDLFVYFGNAGASDQSDPVGVVGDDTDLAFLGGS